VTSCSAGTSGVAGALILGHATPDAVTLGGGEGVGAAVGEHGAVLADLFGGALTLGPGRAAFTVRGEEDLGVCTAAGGAALPGKVDEVVRMIRHCRISRFRSRTVTRFAGKSGHALVRMAGLGQWPTVGAQKIDTGMGGVASLERGESDRLRATALVEAWCDTTPRTHHGSLSTLKRSSSGSDCCSRCGTSSAAEAGLCCADACSRHRVGWEASGCPGVSTHRPSSREQVKRCDFEAIYTLVDNSEESLESNWRHIGGSDTPTRREAAEAARSRHQRPRHDG
jgi:hypothetical protein